VPTSLSSGAYSPRDKCRQLGRRPNRPLFPGSNDRPRNPTRRRFLPISKEKIGQLPLAQRVHQIGSRHHSPPIHAHVKRPFVPEAESALRRLQLKRRGAEIRENTLDP
jgi:hypothetical protein